MVAFDYSFTTFFGLLLLGRKSAKGIPHVCGFMRRRNEAAKFALCCGLGNCLPGSTTGFYF
jgi:hypothetical protein